MRQVCMERMLLSDSTVLEGPGTVTIVSDSAYLITLHFQSEEFELDKSAPANITFANNGYNYFNYTTSTDLKCAFTGTIDADGVNTISFTITQMENRRVKKFQYTFNGVKSEALVEQVPSTGEGVE